MSSNQVQLRLFLDAGVPDSVGIAFKECGHFVIFCREVLDDGASDELVCITAMINDAILVAIDKDMKQIAKRFGINYQNDRFLKLNLIRICCNEVMAAKRVQHVMSFIEHEWRISSEKVARRLWIDIAAHYLRSNR